MVSMVGIPMSKEQVMDWLEDLDRNVKKALAEAENDETVPYEELFFLSADGS